MAVWGGLTNSCEKKGREKQRRKGKIYPFECRVPKNSKERQESLPQWSMQKKIEKNSRMWKTRDLFKKIRDSKGIFHAKMGTVKDRNCMDLTGEGNGTRLQYSCLENPMDGGAWKAAVHGVAEGQTRLSDFTFTFHFHALEKEMATHSSVLAWRIPGIGEPSGLPSMGSHRVGHDWSDLAEGLTLSSFSYSSINLVTI